jgi:hypothetical protein
MVATEATAEDTAAIAELDVVITKALDPLDNTEVGVKRNLKKKWADSKVVDGINLKSDVKA